MKPTTIPEVGLALSVLASLAADLQSRSHRARRRARDDVAAGGIDYWIEVVDVELHVGDALRARIGLLARSDPAGTLKPRLHVAA